MENHYDHQQTTSSPRDIFSFPSPPGQEQDSDFEFGCLTPDSPSTDPHKNSPADHLFFNGRLLPHSFPVHQQKQQPPTFLLIDNIYRATSRTSSISSKDSLMSSRSNSTNSSRSSVSSARTSSSDSERKLFYRGTSKVGSKTPMASKVVMAQLYGSSQRWQHITTVPILKREDSRRKNGNVKKEGEKLRNHRKQGHKKDKKKKKKRIGLCRRIFRPMDFLRDHAVGALSKISCLQPTRRTPLLSFFLQLKCSLVRKL